MKPKSKTVKTTLKKAQPPEKLKPNFEEIFILCYKFRFLNSEQIQILLNHKYKERIRSWLNELTEEKYLRREYKKKLEESPAIFSLGTKGRKYFLLHPEIQDINHLILDRVWKEYKYSKTFKEHCQFVGHIYISLLSFIKKVGLNAANLRFLTSTDLIGVEHLIHPLPDCYFIIEQKDGTKKRYLVKIFDWYIKKDDMEKTVKHYLNYCKNKTWQDHMHTQFPELIFIFPNARVKSDLNETIKKSLRQKGLDMQIYLSTWDEIKYQGINSKVLHKVEIN